MPGVHRLVGREAHWRRSSDARCREHGFGSHPCIKCKLDRAEYRLLIMMEHKCQYLCHLPIATWPLEDLPLQFLERLGEEGQRAHHYAGHQACVG